MNTQQSDAQVRVPSAIIPLASFDQPYFLTERNTVLLPWTGMWRPIVEAEDEFKVIELSGKKLYACKNTPSLANILYRNGHEVPSPILHDGYDWAGQTLYLSQELTAGLMVMHHRAFILNGMGTGKTLATLLAIDYLIQQGYVTKALVVAPKSVLNLVWEAEIYKRVPRLRPTVLAGSREKRLKGLLQDRWNVAIINVEGVKVIAPELHKEGFDALVLDELALYRERRNERWKIMNKLVEKMDWCWGLTGAPCPNGPWDAYGQIKLLTPWNAPMSFGAFRNEVATEGAFQGKWLPRTGWQNYVYAKMQPAIRFSRSEVIELPPNQTITYDVPMSTLQKDAAKTLIKDLLIKYPTEGAVKAANAAVLLGKLLQIYAGAVYTDTREVIDLQAYPRLDLAAELMREAEGKAIVFVPWIHLCRILEMQLGLLGIRVVNGDTPDYERNQIFTDFQDPNSPVKYLVAHPKCMAHGLNLTAASVIIWYAPYTSHEVTDQANARITRAGQEREQIIYRLSSSAAENKIYKVLDTRGRMQDAILDLFERKFT